jgi:hypothetical protein
VSHSLCTSQLDGNGAGGTGRGRSGSNVSSPHSDADHQRRRNSHSPHHRDNLSNSKENEFPVYFELCALEYNELYPYMRLGIDIHVCGKPLFAPLLAFLLVYVFGIGHIATVLGREHLRIVLWKFFTFILVCCGVWHADDVSVDAYKLRETRKRYFINENMLENELFVNEITETNMTRLLSAIVGTRAILLMM